jgi:hypothetical protein
MAWIIGCALNILPYNKWGFSAQGQSLTQILVARLLFFDDFFKV